MFDTSERHRFATCPRNVAAQTIRDAEGAATTRKLKQLKNARDLQDLLDELEADTD